MFLPEMFSSLFGIGRKSRGIEQIDLFIHIMQRKGEPTNPFLRRRWRWRWRGGEGGGGGEYLSCC